MIGAETRDAVGTERVVLIFADLALDVCAALPASDRLRPLLGGDSVRLSAPVSPLVGGTAWLLATAILKARRRERPLILAAIGADPAGDLVMAGLRDAGAATDGIQRVTGLPTSVCAMLSMERLQRLMIHPGSHAGHLLEREAVAARLDQVRRAACTWISGYCLVGLEGPRRAAIRYASDWSRERGVPVVLDLVPHEFHHWFKSVEDVEQAIGPIDGVVGEYRTFVRLGYAQPSRLNDHSMASIGEVASAVSRTRRFAVVQHRARPGTYAQVLAALGAVRREAEYQIPESGLRGLGDSMATEALGWAGLLTQEA